MSDYRNQAPVWFVSAEFLSAKGYEVHGMVRRSKVVQYRSHRPLYMKNRHLMEP